MLAVYFVIWTLLGGVAPKGHFLSPDSLDKSVFFDKYSLAKGMFFFRSP